MSPTKEERWERDRILVKRCLKGDAEAWEGLIRKYRRLIFSVPVAMKLDADRSEEIFQEVCVRLYTNLEKLKRVEGLASWLSTTARRQALRTLEGARKFQEVGDEDALDRQISQQPGLAERLEQVEAEHALQLALAALDDPCASLIRALYLEDPKPSYSEIAGRLGRPVGSLGPTASRCLKKLRRLYRDSGGAVPWEDAV